MFDVPVLTKTIIQSGEMDVGQDENMDFETDMASSDIDDSQIDEAHPGDSPTSTQELLRPLQETADRVSRQIEQFAKALDRFISKKNDDDSEATEQRDVWKETLLLLDDYSDIAGQDANQAKPKSPTPGQIQKNRKSLGDSAAQTEGILLESKLWQLTAQLLPCKYLDLIDNNSYVANAVMAELHRYSSNHEIWAAFLEIDRIAGQYQILLEWLQDWKREISPPIIDEETLDSYDKTHRGGVMWADGNLFTQAPIKTQKRTRVHPGPLLPNPDIRAAHVRKTDGVLLVTQMDPDAVTRQVSHLEPEDEALERSAWHASWELLRRGESMRRTREWFEDRTQLWRSLVIRNPPYKPVNVSLADQTIEQEQEETRDRWCRVMNFASNREYMTLCHAMSESGSATIAYEKAVYGILCGNYAASAPVCKSLDDHFFALFNELFIERFEKFTIQFRKNLADSAINDFNLPLSSIGEVTRFFNAAQTNAQTKSETHQPLKYLQGMLMCDQIAEFLLELGHAAAKMAHATQVSHSLFDKDETQINECAQVASQNEDVVRMAVHLQLALDHVGELKEAYETDEVALENNIINYIALLERRFKYALIPLYASRLQPNRQPRIMGRILANVVDPKERNMQMKLMKQYQIPVYQVVYTICDYARRSWEIHLKDSGKEGCPQKFVTYVNKIARTNTDFIGVLEETDPAAHVIEAHEWVAYMDVHHWGMAVWLVTSLYKSLLFAGKLAAAKDLAERVDLATTSLKVTGMNLSVAALIQDEDPQDDSDKDMDGDQAEDENLSKLASPSKRRREPKLDHPLAKETTDRSKLAEQSITWAHLEQLVLAMDALELWQTYADEVNELARQDDTNIRTAKKNLNTALQAVHHAMQPLLEQGFLTYANDEAEDDDLASIRKAYLPECILAYNSALYFAGHAITRQHLVQCMELAQKVAKNSSLTQAFVDSKRMSELVTAFANDSHALLRANEQRLKNDRGRGGKRNPANGMHGGRADIWQVSWKDD